MTKPDNDANAAAERARRETLRSLRTEPTGAAVDVDGEAGGWYEADAEAIEVDEVDDEKRDVDEELARKHLGDK